MPKIPKHLLKKWWLECNELARAAQAKANAKAHRPSPPMKKAA
jgi:hypothetical protein